MRRGSYGAFRVLVGALAQNADEVDEEVLSGFMAPDERREALPGVAYRPACAR